MLAVACFLLWRFRRELDLPAGRAELFGLLVGNREALVLSALLTSLLVYPVWSYLTYSWVRKREEILSSLTDRDKDSYLALFHGTDHAEAHEDASSRFARIYDHWYGRHRYVPPIVSLVVAGFTDCLVLAQALKDTVLTLPAAAAAGGYAYVTYDLILRQQRRDLSASDVLRGALRLAIAIPLGMSFSSLMKPDSAMFLAFAVGVFPLDSLALILRRLANKKLELEIGVDGAKDQVSTLTGIDEPTADRIHQADITTVSQLAWCDPVQLSMRSNLSFSFVLDIVSQALAWAYLGEKLKILAPLGLRGAVEIRDLLLRLRQGNADEVSQANAVVNQAADAIAVQRPGLMNAFEQIADDAATDFLYSTIVPASGG